MLRSTLRRKRSSRNQKNGIGNSKHDNSEEDALSSVLHVDPILVQHPVSRASTPKSLLLLWSSSKPPKPEEATGNICP